ncbi:citrate synthase [Pseudalkalibacillus sp. A8]|uniref:citrate synthase n=1 Tax=Pseudalkalibacillus sp. A8 TaxID=3382641 RepID=UPI0038B61F1D
MTTTRGLEGIVATTSSVSSIIDGVLTYRGYNIDDLADYASFEEVVYLLWYGKLPNQKELDDFNAELSKHYALPEQVLDMMKSFPLDEIHPMAAVRTAISALGLYDSEADEMSKEANFTKAIRLQAKLASIVAAFSRLRDGQEVIQPNEKLSYAANFLYMLNGKEPDGISEKAVNKALVLHADHELNASTFTARVCVATLSDMYSGVTAAIGALKGPLHGGANERVMKMLTEIGNPENVESYLKQALERKEKIMGFGHRVYKNGDPRAKHLREMSKQLTSITGETKWYDMSVKLDKLMTNEKGLLPNVDFYSASVYHSLGLKHDLFTPIFAMSRVSGWLAHILEQYENNRLIRPRAEYTGPSKQKYVSIENR